MVFRNFFSVHFYCDEEEEKEEQEQEKQEKEKKLYSHYRKTFNVQPSWLDSAKTRRISPRKALRNQQKPTGTKNLTYFEKWLTAKVITLPPNRGSVSSFSVASIHSFFSELESLKRMRTRATDLSMSFL